MGNRGTEPGESGASKTEGQRRSGGERKNDRFSETSARGYLIFFKLIRRILDYSSCFQIHCLINIGINIVIAKY